MSIYSSQGSVVLLLVVVLLMENRRRGLFLGRSVPLSRRVTDFARRYHSYLFSWAAIYTFWYHPTENTVGHLIGFFSMFLLLVQGSLFLPRARIVIGTAYVAAVALAYYRRGWGSLDEIIRIPAIEYLLVIVAFGLVWLGPLTARAVVRVRSGRPDSGHPDADRRDADRRVRPGPQ